MEIMTWSGTLSDCMSAYQVKLGKLPEVELSPSLHRMVAVVDDVRRGDA